MTNLTNLKEVLFFRANAEYEGYEDVKNDPSYTAEDKARAEERFFSAYQIIEEAELKAEYEAWRRAHKA